MHHEFVPMGPLAVTRISLEEQDLLVCQRALLGKRVTFLYTIVAICCASATGIYAIAGYAGAGNASQTKMVLVALLCLLLASAFYFGVPKWLAKFRFRQYMTTNITPRSIAFYPDRFEILIDGAIAGVYPYALVRRVIRSEDLVILVLSNLLYLPIRSGSLQDERWLRIEKQIAEAMELHRSKTKEGADK